MNNQEIAHIRKLYEEFEAKCNDENVKVVELTLLATTLAKHVPNLLAQLEASQELLQMTIDTFPDVKKGYGQIIEHFEGKNKA
ncbi:hypothetical protein QUF99_15030 [Bacillus sp. DX4.1]|uniref:hypothetical protein n=1 Tax=Bacillus sp. DX4.1 TaxID=3055867 RepID=UPI0025A04081|nr:hypothetical protein [Bacillus sp. DX4.1]MDM5188581.1 hypothetical protein [Bacillus sp. DX4.1]